MPSWTFWKTQKQKNLSWNGTKKSLKKEKKAWKKENFILIRDIRSFDMEIEISDFTGCKIALFCGDKLLTILRDDKANIPWAQYVGTSRRWTRGGRKPI